MLGNAPNSLKSCFLNKGTNMKNNATTKYRSQKLTTLKIKKESIIRKMEADGWELTEVVDGKLQTTLRFRKPVKHINMKIAIPATIATVALLATAGIQSVLEERPDEEESVAAPHSQSSTPSPSNTRASTAPDSMAPASTITSERSEASAFPTPSTSSLGIITPENNPEFAEILNEKSECSPLIKDFASTYDGETVSFDGSIVNILEIEGYRTVVDVLISPGNFSETSQKGPHFKFEEVQPAVSMHFPADDPAESIYVGQNLHFEAEIESFDQNSCLLYLDPIKTTSR